MMQCILQSHYGALEVELPMPRGAACLIPHILVQAPKAAQVSQDVCYSCKYRLEQSPVSRCMLMMHCICNLILEPWRWNFPCLGSSVYVQDAVYLQSHCGALEVELPMPRVRPASFHIIVQAPKAAQVSQDVCYSCKYRSEQSHVPL
jgi:hypothetical protein